MSLKPIYPDASLCVHVEQELKSSLRLYAEVLAERADGFRAAATLYPGTDYSPSIDEAEASYTAVLELYERLFSSERK